MESSGVIIGPLTHALGVLFNIIFNFVYSITPVSSLGISVIVLTLIVKGLMWPFNVKQLKSSLIMQKLQPEIKQLQAKYPDRKNVESQQKLNMEIRKLYAKYKINPTGGCLINFVMLPIFIALTQLLSSAFYYVDKIKEVSIELATKIMQIPDYVPKIHDLAITKLPALRLPADREVNLLNSNDLQMIVNKFTSADWRMFLSKLDITHANQLTNVLEQKHTIENIGSISLVDVCGLSYPGVIIPILAVITTVITSYLSFKMSPATDETARTQQRVMLIMMPFMIAAVSVFMSVGIGLYFIASSVIQLMQQLSINKYREEVNGNGKAG